MQISFKSLTDSWTSLSDLITVEEGTVYFIQNRGPDVLAINENLLTEDDESGVLIMPYDGIGIYGDISLKAYKNNCSVNISTVEDSSGGGAKNKKKFNASIDTFVGDVSMDGSLTWPSEEPELSFDGVKHLSAQILAHRFYNTPVKSIDFKDLEDINGSGSMEYAFYNSGVDSISFLKLEGIHGATSCYYAFAGCDFTSVEFPLLKELTGYRACENMFDTCRRLTSVSFPSLDTFESFTNQLHNMLHGCQNVTVHFKSSIQSIISSWQDVIDGFGGTNTTVLFDL